MTTTPQQLLEKWKPVLDSEDVAPIKDRYRRMVVARLLENQEADNVNQRQMLNEAAPANITGNVDKYDPVLIGLVRRSMPLLLAYDVCGVQPMALPTGLVFALKSRYVDNATLSDATEALFNEADNAYSGDYTTNPGDGAGVTPSQWASGSAGTSPVDSTVGLDPWDGSPGFVAGGGPTGAGAKGGAMSTTKAEGVTPAEMGFTIEKHSVTAASRALKAEYSIEMAQDLKAVHGLDAESELSNILSREILVEINREVVRTMMKISKTGSDSTTTPGTFDLDVDANGRWSVERFKGLIFNIERDANRIAQTTRRGKGNFIICSADVASALVMTGLLSYTPAIQANLEVDQSATTFAGVLNGHYKVYVDPYLALGASSAHYYMVGYKGTSPYDAGMFYCPYVPLQLLRAVDPNTFQPKIGFKTRYGLIGNPLAGLDADSANNVGLAAGKNAYYRLSKVANLT
jgi:hypothetical protein